MRSVVVITTDKVYENKGDGAIYKVGDQLAGKDPVAASNTGAEYVIEAYKHSYLPKIGISAARPSNVIAGGDHVATRLIPSILHGFANGTPSELRNPEQSRSWQSVLDALNGYLTIARKLYENPREFSIPWNIGPTKEGISPVGYIFEKIRGYFDSNDGYELVENSVKESLTLGLDIEDSMKHLGWQPEQPLDKILFELTDYFKRQQAGECEREICKGQIAEFFDGEV